MSRRDADEAQRQIRADPVTEAFGAIGVRVDEGAGERLELFRRAADICPQMRLDVAGHEVAAQISEVELWRFYLPVCQAIAGMAEGREGRLVVGVTGPGASGKSVFAALVREVIARAFSDRRLAAAACPMDGFHYANAYLDSHLVDDGQGGTVPLRVFKGLPQTVDAEAFRDTLVRLKTEPVVAIPRYDRRIHDSVENGIQVGPGERVVIVEGNFLLLDQGRWAGLPDLLDLSVFLVQPVDTMRQALMDRHVLGGRSQEDALEHFGRVDVRIYETCMGTLGRADLIVRRDGAQRVVAIEEAICFDRNC